MRVEAIYDHGWLQLPPGIHLKRSRFSLTVTIPDHELAAGLTDEPDEPSAGRAPGRGRCRDESSPRGSIRAAIDEILGPWKEQIQSAYPVPDRDYDALRYEALEEKYLDRR